MTVSDLDIMLRAQLHPWQYVHNRMRRAFDYVVGKQTTGKQREYMERMHRIMRHFNIVLKHVVTIDGHNHAAQLRTQAKPRGMGDEKNADRVTAVIRQNDDECDAPYNLSRILTDNIISGYGVAHNRWMPTSRYPDGQYKLIRGNVFNYGFPLEGQDITDPNESKIHWCRVWVPYEEIARMVEPFDPVKANYIRLRGEEKTGLAPGSSNVTRFNQFSSFKTISSIKSTVNVSDYYDSNYKLFALYDVHEERYTEKSFIISNTGEEIPVDNDILDSDPTLVKSLLTFFTGTDNERRIITKTIPEWWSMLAAPGITTEESLYEKPYDYQGEGCQIVWSTCYGYHPELSETLSLVESEMDAQDLMNRRENMIDDLTARELHPDYHYEEGSLTTEQLNAYRNYKDIGRMLARSPNSSKPERDESRAQLIGLLLGQSGHYQQLADQITGITPPLYGEKQSKKDGAELFQQQTEQGTIVMKPIIESAKRLAIRCAKHNLAMSQTYIKFNRWVRVYGEGGTVKSQFMLASEASNEQEILDKNIGKYDIMIAQEAATTLQREQNFQRTNALVERVAATDQNLAFLLTPEYLKHSGLPDADRMADKFRLAFVMRYGAEMLPLLENPELLDKMVGAVLQMQQQPNGQSQQQIPQGQIQ